MTMQPVTAVTLIKKGLQTNNMNDIHPYIGAALLIAFIIIDAVLYAFEAALFTVNESSIRQKEESEDDKPKVTKLLIKFLDNPALFGNTLDITVFITNVAVGGYILGAINRAVFAATQVNSLWVAFLSAVIIVTILLVLGVIVPKRVGMKYPVETLYALCKNVYLLMGLLTPVSFIVTGISHGVLRLIGINPHENLDNVTEEEIITMVNEGQEMGVLEANEAEMITNIFEFGDKEAHDVMIHRSNIVGIEMHTSLEEAFKIMLNNNYTRYPVYDEDIDHITGMIHLRDATIAYENDKSNETEIANIKGLVRDVYMVPETRNVDALFKEMQAKKIQFAVVVDEYGQTSGIITLEDIIEEIVGNIMDEYDEEEEQIEQTAENSYEVDGLTSLDDLEELLDITFDTEDFETINGFLISILHRLPAEDEQWDTDYKGFNFKILEVKNKVIRKLLITKLDIQEEVEDDSDSKETLE